MKCRTVLIVGLLCCLGLSVLPAMSHAQGLYGEYYGTTQLSDLRVSRIDPQVFFDWKEGSPDPKIPVNYFSVCWTGSVVAEVSGTYTFFVTADDGVRLWMDDVLEVNAWKGQSPTEYSVEINLTEGESLPVRLEYYESTGDAVIKFEWKGPDIAREPVPAACLVPGDSIGDRVRYWHSNPNNGHFYRVIGSYTWHKAREEAIKLGGYLVVINDAQENQWISEMFRPVASDAWTGANDIEEEGTWVWDHTGENFFNGDYEDGETVAGFYSNWSSGEPNNANDDEDAGTITMSQGNWNDLNVIRERFAIVESDVPQINYDGPVPLATRVALDNPYTVSVTVLNPTGVVQYQWLKDGAPVSGANSAVLTIPHVIFDDAGLYSCQISDESSANIMTKEAELIVVEALPVATTTGLIALGSLLSLAAICSRRKK